MRSRRQRRFSRHNGWGQLLRAHGCGVGSRKCGWDDSLHDHEVQLKLPLSGLAVAPDLPPEPMSVFNVPVAPLRLTGPNVPQDFECTFGFFCKFAVDGYYLESEDQLLVLTEGSDCF